MDFDPECLSAEIYDLVREIPAGRVATDEMVARPAGILSYARWGGAGFDSSSAHMARTAGKKL